MGEPYTIRASNRSDSDLASLLAILRESYRVLDPDFLDAGLGFDAATWGRMLRDPDTDWAFLHAPDGQAAGFAGWRIRPIQCHLHALFVSADYQRHGYARAMLDYHWRAALRRQPNIRHFTLHVREFAAWARPLYESAGYHYYRPGEESIHPAIQSWIEACHDYGTWPLPPHKLLMHRPADDIVRS